MKKRISALMLASIMVLGTVAAAAEAEKTISVTPMTMTVNGQQVTPTKSNGAPAEVFAYDGATYVPLRYLSELLGIQVDWGADDPNTARLVNVPGFTERNLSGNGEAYVFSNFVLHVGITTNEKGEVTAFDFDQAYPAFSWARVAATEAEKENPPEDILVGGISLTSPTREVMAFSKYVSIDDRIFEGTLREEGDPWLEYNSEQTVKYSSVDGEIEDLTQWMSESQENMAKYFAWAQNRAMFPCLEDGTPNPRATGTECLVKDGLPHAGEVAYLRSETDVSVELPYFDWATNEAAIYESILGTTMGTDPAELTQVKGENGKNYWKTVDGVTGATLATYGLFYGTAKGVYDGIVTGK